MTLELDKSASKARTGESLRVEAGARGAGDYRCVGCGYGIVTFGLVPTCPMCHGSAWKTAAPSSSGPGPARASLAEH
jgi:lipopolysaccharide biosynthesis regulator YciM